MTLDFMHQQYHVYSFRTVEGRCLGHFFSEDPSTPQKWLWHGVTLSAQRLIKKVRWTDFGCFGRQIFVFECLIEDDQDDFEMRSQNHNLSEVPVTQKLVKEWFRRDEIARIWVAREKERQLSSVDFLLVITGIIWWKRFTWFHVLVLRVLF